MGGSFIIPNSTFGGLSSSSGLISTVPLNTVNTGAYNGMISSMPIGGGFGGFGGLGGGFGGLMAIGAMMGPLMMLINAMARNKQNKKAQAKAAAEKAQKNQNKINQNQNNNSNCNCNNQTKQNPSQSSFLKNHTSPNLGVNIHDDYSYNPEIEYTEKK